MHPESKAAQYAEQQRLDTFLTSGQIKIEYADRIAAVDYKLDPRRGYTRRQFEALLAPEEEALALLNEEMKWYPREVQ
jgi:hypothetical protein